MCLLSLFSLRSLIPKQPSIQRNQRLWNAVALQQEFMKDMQIVRRPQKVNRKKLSLAQQLGLAERPEPELTGEDWKHVEKIALERKHHHDPCPICMEQFGMEKQVILNCSHVFHAVCLRNFEKFTLSQTDQVIRCPMCRKEDYQKKLTSDGKTVTMNRAATIIQSVYRGYRIRKLYRRALLDINPAKKREYYANKLCVLSEKLSLHHEAHGRRIDNMLADIDYNLQKSRLVYLTDDDWSRIVLKARDRAITDCPICMSSLFTDKSTRECIVTSCGHCFHAQCLSSFESLTVMHRTMCPICRAPYAKRPYTPTQSSE